MTHQMVVMSLIYSFGAAPVRADTVKFQIAQSK